MSTSGAGGTDLQILGMAIGLWSLLSIVAFSVFITLFTNWVLTGFRRPAWPRHFSLGLVVTTLANLVWLFLVTVAGVLASRYIERMRSAVLGYLAFSLGILLLSLVRAYLYRGLQEQQKQQMQEETRSQLRFLVHHSSYVLFALMLYLGRSSFSLFVLERYCQISTLTILCWVDCSPSSPGHSRRGWDTVSSGIPWPSIPSSL
jgi:cytochrome b561